MSFKHFWRAKQRAEQQEREVRTIAARIRNFDDLETALEGLEPSARGAMVTRLEPFLRFPLRPNED